MQINKILLTGLLCAFHFFTLAQNAALFRIKGKIQSTENQAIEGASVRIRALKAGTVSTADGSYQLSVSKAGQYLIEASAVGYLTRKQNIDIKNIAEEQSFDLILQNDDQQMQTVNVVGKTEKRKLAESGFNVNAIETKALANSTADLNQVLSRSTGIRVRESGGLGSDFNFSINGLSGKQVKFFIDGIPMESFGNSMSLNNIPVNLAQRIEIYKGVVPVELGADALGGAVNIVTNQQVKQYLDMSYSYGSFNSHRASLSGRYTDAKTGFTVNANGFYNYADNNYTMKEIEVYDYAQSKYVEKNFKRFNDGFRSGMGQLELGYRDKSWADVLLLGMLYSSSFKEIQTGATQEKVFGKVHTYGDFAMPSLKYKKNDLFVKGLSASLFATYAKEKSTTVDTAIARYDWTGNVIGYDKNFGERDQRSIWKYTNNFAILRANIAYVLDANNSFSLNYALSAGRRKAIETLKSDQSANTLDVPNKLDKGVLGLSWQNQLFNERLSTSVFAKQYRLHTYIREAKYYNGTGYVKEEAEKTKSYYGYGVATRFKITEEAGLKASYEHAFRLPEVEELFGDGNTILATPGLNPEESDNLNLGIYASRQINDHHFAIEGSAFYRKAKNFIQLEVSNIFAKYRNIGNTQITGLDGEIRYNYKDLLSFTVNASYMNAVKKDPGAATKDERIPNQPWLFGNADLGIGKNDLLGKGSRIQLNWFTQYTHWFYLYWPDRAVAESKSRIPGQTVHNATLTYSVKEGKYNFSLESRNIFDTMAYDNFRLQKPGRAFFLKFRYFIK
ncbi:energy transducer TonB [Pedobacter sp. KBW06]|uniref:TonB-dependent receptor n=1 Tax=Pedobacter sp. KBW06 TaxID=2153359 RepID=UPI000F59D3D7|nr:TonB-dependent receptor [Pedobacter sp. KBW06]RQO73925.1 energy transducer TonB [Pedobacter sp. KBW06]